MLRLGSGVALLAALVSGSALASAAAGADLRVDLSGPGRAAVGSTVVYTAFVRNEGPQQATSVSFIDNLPAGESLLSATATRGTCATTTSVGGSTANGVAGGVQCSLGTLDPRAQSRITIIVRVTGAGNMTQSGRVTAAEADPDSHNNAAAVTTTVSGSGSAAPADLQVTLEGPAQARVGQRVFYVARVRNAGPARATVVRLTDQASALESLIGARASQGSCARSGSVQCSLGSLGAGAQARVTLVFRAMAAGSATHSVSVAADETDPNAQNNTAALTTAVSGTAVAGGADLQVSLEGPSQAKLGGFIGFVARVRNAGPQEATSVRFTDQLSSQGRLFSARSTRGACGFHVHPMTAIGTGTTTGQNGQAAATPTAEPPSALPAVCSIARLGPGAEARVTIVVRATSAGTLTQDASATADQADPNSQNNRAQLSTAVVGPTTTPGADLSVRLESRDRDRARAGAVIRFLARVRNNGPSQATSVMVTLRLPGHGRLVSATSSLGSCGATTAAPAAASTCAIGTLDPGAQAWVTLIVRVHGHKRLTVGASVGASQPDPNMANNQDSTTTFVRGGRRATGRGGGGERD